MFRSTAPSMVDEAKVKVASGLRPKARHPDRTVPSDPSAVSNALYSKVGSTKQPICDVNPLDRLCEMLLDWRILEEITDGRSSKNTSSSENTRLPNYFPTHELYLSSWEPLLLEEIKASVLSNLPLSTRKLSKSGRATVSGQGSNQSKSVLVNLNCAFTSNSVKNDEQNGNSNSWRDAPTVMDLVLLSTKPMKTPLDKSSVAAMPKNQVYMLAMITSNTRPDGTRGFQIKGLRSLWSAMKSENEVVTSTKEDGEKKTPSAAASTKTGSAVPVKYTTKQQIVDKQIKKKPVTASSTSSSTSTSSNGVTDMRHPNTSKNSVESIGRSGTDALYLHYIILDGLTSSWREYLAIHEMPRKVLLTPHILAGITKGISDDGATPTGRGPSKDCDIWAQNDLSKCPIPDRKVSALGSGDSHGMSLMDPSALSISSSEAGAGIGQGAGGVGTGAGVETGTGTGIESPLYSHRNGNDSDSDGGDSPPPPPPSPPPDDDSKTLNADAEPSQSILEETKKWEDLGLTHRFLTVIKRSSNVSQLEAVYRAVSCAGFTLIQGPPGTGKTSTVLNILNAFHIREYDKYYRIAVDIFLGEEGLRCRRSQDLGPWLNLISKVSKSKPRILAVAPSNVAVDEMIERVMQKGFIDGKGDKYYPTILRLGMSRGSGVRAVSLEDTLEEERSAFKDEKNRDSFSRNLDLSIRHIIVQIYAVQGLMINLKIAFHKHPMPLGWELRVAAATGIPYWVDHINRCTSPFPPNLPPPHVEVGYRSIQLLPEYLIHEAALTQLLDALHKQHLVRSRHLARVQNLGQKDFGATKELLETSVIEEAHIVFTTVNGSGHPSLESMEFCVTIIDEAAQCTEPSALIPLRRGCHQCIMVGDQKQLSSIVFSDKAKRAGYGQSLFGRLTITGQSSIMLDTQYRMDPLISGFASRMFYHGKLLNGNNVVKDEFRPAYLNGSNTEKLPAERASDFLDDYSDIGDNGESHVSATTSFTTSATTSSSSSSSSSSGNAISSFQETLNRMKNAANNKIQKDIDDKKEREKEEENKIEREKLSSNVTLKPFLFFDLLTSKDSSSQNKEVSQSLSNIEEAKLCINILETLIVQARNKQVRLGPVGVITPYSDQVIEIKRRLHSAGLTNDVPVQGPGDIAVSLDIEVSTVDSFQGREKDIIIVSCVRANDEGSIGFLSDPRRMNVALTRARYGLYVVACGETLSSNPRWNRLIEYAQENDAILKIEDAYQPIMPLLLSQKLLRHSSSVKESSSKINHKRRTDDGDRRPSTSSSDISKTNNFIERKGEGGGGDKRQRTAPLVPENGVNRPVLKTPTSSSNNVEDGELSESD